MSTNGKDMIKSFLFNVAGLTGSFTLDDRETECINYIKKTVGNKKVVVRIAVFFETDSSVRSTFFLFRFIIFSVIT